MNETEFDFMPFFLTLERLGIREEDLEDYGIPSSLVKRMKNSENMRLSSLACLMRLLKIGDVNDVVKLHFNY